MLTAAEIYDELYQAYGQPSWWSDDPYTVMVQSILVQNTAWASVQKVTAAIGNLLTPSALSGLETEKLEELIRPCGFCKGKAAAIRRLTEWFQQYECNAEAVKALSMNTLRRQLLAIKGIGEETADVILVYGFHKPSFIIDAYTRRLLERLGFHFADDNEIRRFFEQGIERDACLYGWYHWLILEHGISHCKKAPVCEECVFTECGYAQ